MFQLHPFYEKLNSEQGLYFRIMLAENLTFPPHLHKAIELIYVLEGSNEITINDNRTLLHPGQLMVMMSNHIHSYVTEKSSKAIILIFDPELMAEYFVSKEGKTIANPCITISKNSEIPVILNQLLHEHANSNNTLIIKGLLYILFGNLNELLHFTNSVQANDHTIQKLIAYLDEHYSEQITLELLAKNLCLSKFYVSRLLNQRIKCSLKDYVNRIRINKALWLLTETKQSITEISYECGYDSVRSFNRVFKQIMRATPTEYRKKLE